MVALEAAFTNLGVVLRKFGTVTVFFSATECSAPTNRKKNSHSTSTIQAVTAQPRLCGIIDEGVDVSNLFAGTARRGT